MPASLSSTPLTTMKDSTALGADVDFESDISRVCMVVGPLLSKFSFAVGWIMAGLSGQSILSSLSVVLARKIEREGEEEEAIEVGLEEDGLRDRKG